MQGGDGIALQSPIQDTATLDMGVRYYLAIRLESPFKTFSNQGLVVRFISYLKLEPKNVIAIDNGIVD